MKIVSTPISPSPHEIRTPHVEVFKSGLYFYRSNFAFVTHQLIKNIKRAK